MGEANNYAKLRWARDARRTFQEAEKHRSQAVAEKRFADAEYHLRIGSRSIAHALRLEAEVRDALIAHEATA